MICGLLTADFHSGSRLSLFPPNTQLNKIEFQPNLWQRYLWTKYEDMLRIISSVKIDFYVHLGDLLQGPASQKGSTYETMTNEYSEQLAIARATLDPILEHVPDHPNGGKCWWLCKGSTWHEGDYATVTDTLAELKGAQKFEDGEWTGDVLDLNFDGVIANFAHHQSYFYIYKTTAMERELRDFAEYEQQIIAEVDGQDVLMLPDLVARAHTHRHVEVTRYIHGRLRHAISVPAWKAVERYAIKRGIGKSWPELGFSLVWLDPDAKRKGRRCVWTETVVYPHPKRRAIRLP